MMALSQNTNIIIGVGILCVSLLTGFMIGHLTVKTTTTNENQNEQKILSYHKSLVKDLDSLGFDELVKNVDPEMLRKNLLYIYFDMQIISR